MSDLEIVEAVISQNSNFVEFAVIRLSQGHGLLREEVDVLRENVQLMRSCMEAMAAALRPEDREKIETGKMTLLNRCSCLEEMLGEMQVRRS